MRSLAGYRYRHVTLDVALVAGVAVLLAGFHYLLLRSFQASLYFRHDLSQPWTLLTAAYLHATDAHLSQNVLGYLLAAAYAYALCLGAHQRRWFHRTFVALVVVLPALVNLSSYAVFAVRYPGVGVTSSGFSGVVGGFTGFLLVALYAFVRRRCGERVGWAVAASAFLVLLLSVDSRYAGGVRPPVVGLVAAGILLSLAGLSVDDSLPARPRAALRAAAADVVTVGLVCVVLGVLTLGLFPPPSDIVNHGSFTDVFAHASGLSLGVLLSSALLLVSDDTAFATDQSDTSTRGRVRG